MMEISKKVTVESLYLKPLKRQCIYSSIEDSKVVPVFEHNNIGLKKLSGYVRTDK
jgi:hypothetical protein